MHQFTLDVDNDTLAHLAASVPDSGQRTIPERAATRIEACITAYARGFARSQHIETGLKELNASLSALTAAAKFVEPPAFDKDPPHETQM